MALHEGAIGRLTDLAQLAVKAEQLGLLDNWKHYLLDEAKKAGHSKEELVKAIERERGKG